MALLEQPTSPVAFDTVNPYTWYWYINHNWDERSLVHVSSVELTNEDLDLKYATCSWLHKGDSYQVSSIVSPRFKRELHLVSAPIKPVVTCPLPHLFSCILENVKPELLRAKDLKRLLANLEWWLYHAPFGFDLLSLDNSVVYQKKTQSLWKTGHDYYLWNDGGNIRFVKSNHCEVLVTLSAQGELGCGTVLTTF